MPDKLQTNKMASNNSSVLTSNILKAEKQSIFVGLPIGVASGLIAYFASSSFPLIHALVIGIGALVTTAMLLFYFRFGKDLPKRVITPEEYGSHLEIRRTTSHNHIGDHTYGNKNRVGVQAYNRANGNPPSNFFLTIKRR